MITWGEKLSLHLRFAINHALSLYLVCVNFLRLLDKMTMFLRDASECMGGNKTHTQGDQFSGQSENSKIKILGQNPDTKAYYTSPPPQHNLFAQSLTQPSIFQSLLKVLKCLWSSSEVHVGNKVGWDSPAETQHWGAYHHCYCRAWKGEQVKEKGISNLTYTVGLKWQSSKNPFIRELFWFCWDTWIRT